MKRILSYGLIAIVVVLGGLYAIGSVAKNAADKPVTDEELDALRDEAGRNLKKIDSKLSDMRTALILCEYLECRETLDGRHVYKAKNGEFWFYSDGEIVDFSTLKLKDK